MKEKESIKFTEKILIENNKSTWLEKFKLHKKKMIWFFLQVLMVY